MHRGVPTPFAWQVHSPSTRFHGGQWIRPVATLPYQRNVESVLIPGRDFSGLGALARQRNFNAAFTGLGASARQRNFNAAFTGLGAVNPDGLGAVMRTSEGTSGFATVQLRVSVGGGPYTVFRGSTTLADAKALATKLNSSKVTVPILVSGSARVEFTGTVARGTEKRSYIIRKTGLKELLANAMAIGLRVPSRLHGLGAAMSGGPGYARQDGSLGGEARMLTAAAGLGDMLYRTGEGVFRGKDQQGGGIFSAALSGVQGTLGIWPFDDDDEKAKLERFKADQTAIAVAAAQKAMADADRDKARAAEAALAAAAAKAKKAAGGGGGVTVTPTTAYTPSYGSGTNWKKWGMFAGGGVLAIGLVYYIKKGRK